MSNLENNNEELDQNDARRRDKREHLMLNLRRIFLLARYFPTRGNKARTERVCVNNSSIKAMNLDPVQHDCRHRGMWNTRNVLYLPPSSDPIVNVLLATILQITLTTGMLNCSLTNVSSAFFSLLGANRWSTRLFASSWSNYINNDEQGFTWTDQITWTIVNKKSPELTPQTFDQNQALWDSAK